MPEMDKLRATVKRLNAEGFPISEYTLRKWVKTGKIPASYCGNMILLYYPNVLNYLKAGETAVKTTLQIGAIRRVEVSR